MRRERILIVIVLGMMAVYFIVHYLPGPQPVPLSKPPDGLATVEAPAVPVPPGGAGANRGHPLQEAITASEVLRLTNRTRSENGVHELKENFLLNAIAEERARDMLEKQYFAHVSPTGQQVTDAAQRAGYRYRRLGENLAAGSFLTNQKIIDGWMQSPGHRKNLLSEQFDEIGLAVIKGSLDGKETWIAVQVFGRQSPSVGDDGRNEGS